VRARFKAARIPGVKLRVRVLARDDWFDKWQRHYPVTPLGRRFVVVPLHRAKQFKGMRGRSPVYLDPRGAFGSGGHASTQLMAEMLEKAAGRFRSFLDIGTGTGILAIAAARLGAHTIWACDSDPASVRSARFNLKLNRTPCARLWAGDFLGLGRGPRFGLVGANLISDVLEKGRKVLFGRVGPGGYLAVSGIHLDHLEDFRRAFRHGNFRCLLVLRKRGWAGLLFKKGGR
jgi:ribosomal protein L11 methyltransferase